MVPQGQFSENFHAFVYQLSIFSFNNLSPQQLFTLTSFFAGYKHCGRELHKTMNEIAWKFYCQPKSITRSREIIAFRQLLDNSLKILPTSSKEFFPHFLIFALNFKHKMITIVRIPLQIALNLNSILQEGNEIQF